jgi:ABC-type multidrug transport system fused ATPase/permease subunit
MRGLALTIAQPKDDMVKIALRGELDLEHACTFDEELKRVEELEVRCICLDLRELTSVALRRAVVMVTQENYLFSGSIADNIRFGRPDATMADVEAATRALGAHDFIAALPDGYETQVANQGGRLSAGQRQLVAFARAFLADPAVLILDEATSSLDAESEMLVQEALSTLMRNRTSFVIAHRLSTVRRADAIVVLEQGRIVESGTHDALLARGGAYAKLYELQLQEDQTGPATT